MKARPDHNKLPRLENQYSQLNIFFYIIFLFCRSELAEKSDFEEQETEKCHDVATIFVRFVLLVGNASQYTTSYFSRGGKRQSSQAAGKDSQCGRQQGTKGRRR